MNFLIFRDFSRIFLNFFWIFLDFKIKKLLFISRADVARAIKCCRVTTYVGNMQS